MKPYFEFYSDLDLLMKSLEEIIEKCHEWWLNDEPFSEKEPTSEIWRELENALTDIQDELNDEPFFKDED